MSLSGVIGGHRWPQLKPLCRDCTRHHLFKISAQNVPLFLSNHFVNLTVKEAEKPTETWKREREPWLSITTGTGVKPCRICVQYECQCFCKPQSFSSPLFNATQLYFTFCFNLIFVQNFCFNLIFFQFLF